MNGGTFSDTGDDYFRQARQDFVLNLAASNFRSIWSGLAPTLTTFNLSSLVAVLPAQGRCSKLGVEGVEALLGFPLGWTSMDGLAPVLERLGARRLTEAAVLEARGVMLGNAVSVFVSKWLGDRFAMPFGSTLETRYQKDPGVVSGALDRPMRLCNLDRD